ncbi:hypothetical protein GCM10011490_16470 [Pseudoclavibacter endophyticus]|uniref:Alpha/beta hydrolase n=1 Tax=Pseudoclavibacter endophyticus TaxID=1778590 RepID=A0A6H9WDF6_9MICO|nr:alpha/beta hydrolase [Pseudoclavibacter endophyticus]KAB1648982.1 alpha/beta hydrolase [Pseudoclavibacter endophyticus]GGA66530.1 hypothetical protein GCM10011490_16470 [Pseudoclavibacter endophyticus]
MDGQATQESHRRGSRSGREHDAGSWRAAIEALGTALAPELIEGTKQLCASGLDAQYLTGVEVTRDVAYGPHPRHRLDVYRSADGAGAATGVSGGIRTGDPTGSPVLLFVHGGGFVAGDKSGDGSPFGPNIGAWAAKHGMIGVAMNYRLAPEASWPDGGADVGAAVEWARANASRIGADPERIVLLGQSAGAMHVADNLRLQAEGRAPRVAGAVLVSCMYDVGAAKDLPMHRAYWGDDRSAWETRGSLDTVVETDVPLLLAVAEWDDEQFQHSAAALVASWYARRGTFPPLVALPSHNHLSTVYAVGTPHDRLMPLVDAFVAERTPAS